MGRRVDAVDVCAYLRVSTEEQAAEGISLEAQRERIRAFCEYQGLTLAAVFEDPGGSGKSLSRPGLRAALDWLDGQHGRGLVVAKLDRLSRRAFDWLWLLDGYFGPDARGRSALLSAGDPVDTRTAAGRLYLGFMFQLAEWERDTIVERTRAALDAKRRRGERVGSVPYGFELGADGVTLVPHPGERAAAELAAELRGRGYSLRAIGVALERAGFRPRSGRAWAPARVAELVRRAPALSAEG